MVLKAAVAPAASARFRWRLLKTAPTGSGGRRTVRPSRPAPCSCRGRVQCLAVGVGVVRGSKISCSSRRRHCPLVRPPGLHTAWCRSATWTCRRHRTHPCRRPWRDRRRRAAWRCRPGRIGRRQRRLAPVAVGAAVGPGVEGGQRQEPSRRCRSATPCRCPGHTRTRHEARPGPAGAKVRSCWRPPRANLPVADMSARLCSLLELYLDG